MLHWCLAPMCHFGLDPVTERIAPARAPAVVVEVHGPLGNDLRGTLDHYRYVLVDSNVLKDIACVPLLWTYHHGSLLVGTVTQHVLEGYRRVGGTRVHDSYPGRE